MWQILMIVFFCGQLRAEDNRVVGRLKGGLRPNKNAPRGFIDFVPGLNVTEVYGLTTPQDLITCGARRNINGGSQHFIFHRDFPLSPPISSRCAFKFDIGANVQTDLLCYIFDVSRLAVPGRNTLEFYRNGNLAGVLSSSGPLRNVRIQVASRPFAYRLRIVHRVNGDPAGSLVCNVVGIGGSSPPPPPNPPPPPPNPPPPPPSPTGCGIKGPGNRRDGRIVNGRPTQPNEWPWQVAVNLGGGYCGGTILNANWVLTAAHCTDGRSPGQISVWAGCPGRVFPSNGQASTCQQITGVSQIRQFPSYNFPLNDIALVQVSSSFNLNSVVNAICLPTVRAPTNNALMTILGWGRVGTTSPGTTSTGMKEAEVRSITDTQCNQFYGNVPTNVICVQAQTGETCFGDSGGFLGSERNGRWQQDGLTSFGSSECGTAAPEGFTEIFPYLSWINGIIN